ncbi:MAG: hypothetical protein R3F11_26005 [Verrucomicrobiales bacterium]
MAFNEDDCFDFDEGYRGKNQFWFAIQKTDKSNFGGEHDGGGSPQKNLEPFSRTHIYNATYIGSGQAATSTANNGFHLRDNFAGRYYNSIFHDFKGFFVTVDNNADMQARVGTDLLFQHNTIGTFGGGLGSGAGGAAASALETAIINGTGNTQQNPLLQNTAHTNSPSGVIDPRPQLNSPVVAANGATLAAIEAGDADFIQQVDFRGAFPGPNCETGDANWLRGWTYLDQQGFLAPDVSANPTDVEVTANITTDTLWSNDKSYIMRKTIFVEPGATLWIEPGTTIYGTEDLAEDTRGSLVVARGAKIMAVGTKDNPIVFTALEERDAGPLTLDDNQFWGGVIILGKARLNDNPANLPGNGFLETEGGTDYVAREIEGFPTGGAAGTLIRYGGIHDDDNSGKFCYVSIRYGGYIFDPVNNSEINGLTLGCVGNETEIHHVEVFNNADDGIEFFGGTVNTHHMVMAFNEDDCFDFDEGYRGKNQFWFAIQKTDKSNFGGEHDGGGSPQKNLEPFSRTHIYNATYIGSGQAATSTANNGFHLRDNFAARYYNSIFHDFKGFFVTVDNNADMQARVGTDLLFQHNTIGTFGGGLAAARAARHSARNGDHQRHWKHPAKPAPPQCCAHHLPDGTVDPRPLPQSLAWNATAPRLPLRWAAMPNASK